MTELTKLLLELGPLAVFFIANMQLGIFWATGLFMIATAVSLILSRLALKRLPVMPLVSGVIVLVFGALTLWLQDETFIKIKPTIVNFLFASILLAGLFYGRLFVKILFADALKMSDEGWTKLQFRWALFFIFLGLLNEVMWRFFSTDTWVNFKVFGIMPLTLVFMISQILLLRPHMMDSEIGSVDHGSKDGGKIV